MKDYLRLPSIFNPTKSTFFFNFSAFVFSFLITATTAEAQTNLWSPAPQGKNMARAAQVPDLPELEKGTVLQLDVLTMQALGRTARQEFGSGATSLVELPLPDGSFQKFQIWESQLMENGLAAKFPEIRTYILQGVDDPFARGRMSVSPDEFGAFFTSQQHQQEVFVRKILKSDASMYLSFWGKDEPARHQPYHCGWEGTTAPLDAADQNRLTGANETGDVLKVFRLAMTVTGKLSENQGWTTKAQALAAIVSFLGQINVLYERDLSVRFVLPEAEENLIFLNDATDPFTAYGGGESANENVIITDKLIGAGSFDVGLVLVTGGCCAAGKPSICGSNKAWDFSTFSSLKTTAHEIGHQFNADHTWTSCGPSNNGQFGTNEYGSGTSIMSYTGLCGVDNILPPGDLTYFGVYSQIQMTSHINSQTCYKTLSTGNHVPTSTVPTSGFQIPISTPFELAGTGSDADGDNLTYSWEQVNIRNIDFTATNISIQTPPTATDGNVPIARIFNPSTSPRRTIPQLSTLLSNNSTVFERLPTYTRNIKYRMYTRDNHAGAGGTTHTLVSFEVDGTAGPFLVTAPNTCVTWQAGSSQTVTWDVANTTNANVNCQNVKISLSTDGGYNYSHVLAASTPNDGSENITLPSGICSNQSRIKVEAVGNIFFDISNADFNLENGATPIVKANALQLDGVDDQVEIQNTTLGNFGTGDFTIELWAKTTETDAALINKRAVCDYGKMWQLMVSGGKFRVEMMNDGGANYNSYQSTTSINDGNWHHLAVTRSGTNLKIYVDGNQELNSTAVQDLTNAAPVRIGNMICSGQNVAASMDEIRVWNLARTAAEILEKKNCTLVGNESGLQAYYPVSSQNCGACGTGTTTFEDKTANANHGTMQNGAYASLSTVNIVDCPTCANGTISITTNPTNQSAAVGATATFTAAATGNNLSFQWYRSTDGGANFSEIGGATAASYSHTVAVGQNNWQFKCFVSNGCDVENTTAATLTLTCAAQTLSSITGEAAPCQKNNYTYFVEPNPNIVSWAWTAPAGWVLVNFGNMVFVEPAATSGNLSVVGTDACGNLTAAQTFAVAPVLVEISTQPVSQTVSEGAAANFSVAVSSGGGTTTFRWQESADGGATFSNISGATAAAYSIAAATLAQDDWKLRCIVSNNCLTDTSAVVDLTVNCTASAPAAPAAIAGGTLICANTTLTYSIAPVAGATSYVWTLPAGWTGASTSTSITVTANGTGGILKVKSSNGCGTSADQTLSISINPNACRRAVHFDGANDRLSVGQNGQVLTGDLTVSFWVKPDVLTGSQTLIFNGREFIVGLNGSQIQYKHSDDCCGYDNTVDKTFSGNLTAGAWQFVAITRTTANRSLNFYLNGNFVQNQTYGASFAQPSNNDLNLIFGAGVNGEWSNFKGSLDEIKIWSAARSAAEISQDMLCQPTGSESGLKAYFDFESGQPFGNNVSVSNFSNAATAFGSASVQNLAMSGTSSNVVSGDLPLFLFQDLDGDGFGGAAAGCGFAGATVTNGLDCNDSNAAINPNGTEICNGLDDNCSGAVDDLPNVVASTNVPVTIPLAGTITSTLTVSSAVTSLSDLNLSNLDISHTWISDLTIKLTSPQGTQVVLMNQPCGNYDNILIKFDDESANNYATFPCPPTNNGTYKPWAALAAFDGQNPNGTWTLTITDLFSPDGGTLNAWGISFPNATTTFYTDADGDGFGNAAAPIQSGCSPSGFVQNSTDCDDSTDDIFPGATETCGNNLDDDCDTQIDEGCTPTCDISITSITPTHETCPNANNGALTIAAMGAANLEYSTNGTTFQTSNVFQNLADGNYTVTVRDASNTTCTATGNSTINAGLDNTPPTITCPANQIVVANASCQGTVGTRTAASLSDNCGTPTVSQSPAASTVLTGHNTVQVVTLTATDAASNTATCSFSVTLKDQTQPTITCPANQIVVANASCQGTVGTRTAASSSDNCGTPTVSQSPAASTVLSGHDDSEMVTLTASDGNGNTATCSFSVTLKDQTAPSITCPATQTVTADGSGNYSLADFTSSATASDNCGSPTKTQSPVAGTSLAVGSHTISITATDAASNSNTCTFLVNVQASTPGATLHFDGVNDFVALNSSAVGNFGTGSFSIEFWAKKTGTGKQPVISKRTTCNNEVFWDIIINSENKVEFEEGANYNNLVTTAAISTNVWTHIAVVRNGSSKFIYINGVLSTSTTSAPINNHSTNTSPIRIGRDICSGTFANWFQGSLDEVRIWTKALTAAEIQASMNCEISNSTPSLVANFHFNQGIASGSNAGETSLNDGSGNGNNGTLNSFALTGTSSNWLAPGAVSTSCSPACSVAITSITPTHETCPNANNGALTIAATGAANLEYSTNGTTFQSSNIFQNLADGNYTVTVRDASNTTCTATGNSTINAGVDNTPPTVTCPAAQSVTTNGGSYSLINFTSSATASDNCGTPTKTQSPVAGTSLAVGSHMISITATDAAANSSTCTFNLTVQNSTAVVLAFDGTNDWVDMSTTVSNLPTGAAHRTVEAWVKTTQTTIGNFVSWGTRASNQRVGVAVRSGKAAFIGQVADVTGVATINNGVWHHVAFTYDGSKVRLYVDGVLDITSGTMTLNTVGQNLRLGKISSPHDVEYFNGRLEDVRIWNYARTQTQIAADMDNELQGNETGLLVYYKFNQGIADGSNPSEITLFDEVGSGDGTLNGFALSGATSNWTAPGPSGLITCAVVITSITPTHETCPNANNGSLTIAATGAANLEYSTNGTTFQTSNVFQNLADGNYTVTVRDASNTTCTATGNSTVNAGVDNVAPTIACPANQIVVANSSCGGAVGSFSLLSKTDNCAAEANISESQSTSGDGNLSGHDDFETVTLTADDGNGNSATCSFSVTLKDQTAPTIACPENQIVVANSSCGGAVGSFSLLSKLDNCTASGSISESQSTSGDGNLSGHDDFETVTLTADDGNGNTATCSFSVTLKDQTAPTITCPENQIVVANSSCGGAVGSFSLLSKLDNCAAEANISESQSTSGDGNLSGHDDSEIVTLTASDGNGNTAICSFSVILKDQTAPTITCPTNQIVVANSSCGGSVGSFPLISKTDNCTASGSISESQSTSGDGILSGHDDSETVTLTASDGNGNTATCSFSVTLKDQTAPTAICQNVNVQLNSTGNGSTTAAAVNDGSSDACGGAVSLSLNKTAFSCADLLAGAGALKFDGTNDHVTLPQIAALNNASQVTIEARVTMNVLGAYKPIFTKRLSETVNLQLQTSAAGNKFAINVSNGSDGFESALTTTIVAGQEYFVSMVFDGSLAENQRVKLYVNGVAEALTNNRVNPATTPNIPTIPIYLAREDAAYSNAKISELRIWSTARTAAEVAANVGSELTGTHSGLIANYRFNQGVAAGNNAGLTNLQDATGAFNGTLSNFALVSSASNWVIGFGGSGFAGSNVVTLTATDAVGNSSTCTATVTLDISGVVSTNPTTTLPTCFGNSNGSIFSNVSGGSTPYTYLWSNAKTTANINLLAAGTYVLTVTEASGCSKTTSVTLTQPTEILMSVSATPTTATVSASGGTPSYTYNRTGATTFQPNPFFAGLTPNTSYIFKTKDANGCQKSVIKKTPASMAPNGGGQVQTSLRFQTSTTLGSGANPAFAIFPNPANERLNIAFAADEMVAGRVEIFNQIGQRVLTQNLQVEVGEEGVLQVGQLTQGSYFLVFKPENAAATSERFVIFRD